MKKGISNLENNLNTEKNVVAQERKEKESLNLSFNTKIKKMATEMKKKDSNIKSLQDLVTQFQTKEAKGVTIVANSLEITSDLKDKSPNFYTSASGDFVKMLTQNERSAFDTLKSENEMLRTALKELQKMMIDVIETRKTISKQNFQNLDIGENSSLKEIKDELFNIQGTPMSTNTLMEIRNNITKFKNFFKKFDEVKMKSFNLENIDLSNISSKDQKNLIALKDMIKNSQYVNEQQENLIKNAIAKLKKNKPKFNIVAMRKKLEDVNDKLNVNQETLNAFKKRSEGIFQEHGAVEALINDVFDRLDNKRDEVQRNRAKIESQSRNLKSDSSTAT